MCEMIEQRIAAWEQHERTIEVELAATRAIIRELKNIIEEAKKDEAPTGE